MYEINRSVFLLMPLEPFWRWLQSLPDVDLSDIELEDLQADANAYLVNPCDSADEVWEEIEARFEDIFAAELATGVKTSANGPICTPIFSTNGSTSSSPPSSPIYRPSLWSAKPFKPSP